MNQILKWLLFKLLITVSIQVTGQAGVIFRDGKIVKGTSSFINDTSVIFHKDDRHSKSYDLLDISSIYYGIDTTVLNPFYSTKELFSIQHKNSIEINLLASILNTLYISYERALKPGQSIEFELGYVGISDVTLYAQQPKGYVAKIGFKFLRKPINYLNDNKYAHILKGTYLQPQLIFSRYEYTTPDKGNFREQNATAFTLNFGKQWVYNDIMSFEMWFGVGAGGTSYDLCEFGFIGGGPAVIAFTFGSRIGLLF